MRRQPFRHAAFCALLGSATLALAQIPSANPDQYRLDSGETFVVDSVRGVLANDSPAGGSCLLVAPPLSASSFTLEGDGSFSYTPKAGFSGKDLFKYRIANQDGKSSTVGVRMLVRPVLESLVPSKTSIVGGFEETLVVNLNAPALSGGATVKLGASLGNLLVLPESVFIREGERSRKIALKSNSVTERTELTLSGSYRETTKSVPMVVRVGGLKRVVIAPSKFIGGRALVGTVELTGRAPAGGRMVSLASESGALQVPTSVLVPADESVGTFTITTSLVTQDTSTRVKAKLGCLFRSTSITMQPNSTDPPAVKENVRVIPGDGSVTITPGPLAGQLTLDGNLPTITPGDVIVAEQGEGILRQATTVKPSRGSIVIDTANATLEDVFNIGAIRITQTLNPADLVSFVPDGHGAYIEDRALEVNAPLTFPIRLVGWQLAGGLTVDASMDLALTLNFDADMALTGIKYLKGAVTAISSGNIKITGSVSGSFSRRIGVMYFKPIIVKVGVVPLVLTPQLSLYMNGNLQLSASLTATVTPTVSATLGVEVVNNDFSLVKGVSIASGYSPSITGSISGSATYTPLRAEFRIKLYGNDCLYANLDAPIIHLGFTAKTNPLGVDAYGTISVSGDTGIRFVVLGRTLIDKQFARFELLRKEFYYKFFPVGEPVLTISEQSGRFKWFGPNYVPYLNSITKSPKDGGPLGDGGHMYFTYHSPTSVVNKGQWWPKFVETANYEVFVFIPRWYADTIDARYYVHHANGVTLRRVNQKSYSDQWVSLGTYKFNVGETGYLELADVTSDVDPDGDGPRKRAWIAFDTVKWIKR